MKRAVLTIFFIMLFLCSCARKDTGEYFLAPRRLYVTLESGGVSQDGVLITDSKALSFMPNDPKGLIYSITEKGATVSFDNLTFEYQNADILRLEPVYRALKDNSIELEYKKGSSFPHSVTSDGFTIKIHKELTE